MMDAKRREQKKKQREQSERELVLRSGRSQKSVTRPYDVVKVFSATKARDRGMIGSRATEYLRQFSGSCVDKVVRLSSDREFHCLTLILFMKRD
jgi:hypothetical protein